MIRLDARHHLFSREQVLTIKQFRSIRTGKDGIWDSMMHIKFDTNGIVRDKENGPDPLYFREVKIITALADATT